MGLPGEGDAARDPTYRTEIRHQPTVTVDAYAQKGGTITYGMLLAGGVTLLAVVLMCICIYSKCCAKQKVVKEVTELSPLEKVRAEAGKLEAVSLESQYKVELTEEGEFGGASFANVDTLVGLKYSRNSTM